MQSSVQTYLKPELFYNVNLSALCFFFILFNRSVLYKWKTIASDIECIKCKVEDSDRKFPENRIILLIIDIKKIIRENF